MSIRTDKIYNRNTDNYIDAETLLKYNSDDNTIRTLLDEILIRLDDLEGLNVKITNDTIETWIKKIDDIQNEYDRIYKLLSDLANADLIEKYLDKVDEINKRIDDLQNKLQGEIDDLQNQINDTQDKIDDCKNDLNNKLTNAKSDLDKILHPNIKEIISKLYTIKFTDLLNNKITRFIKNGRQSATRGTTTLNYEVNRNVFESGKTYVHYCFTDTETINYFDLINPITNESKRFNDCGKSSGSNYTCCDQRNQNLTYLLKNQTSQTIKIRLKVYQGDGVGFKDLRMWDEDHPNNLFYIQNSISGINNYKQYDEFKGNFQAISLCDMFNNNYPKENANKYLIKATGDPKVGQFIMGYKDNTYVNNNEAIQYFKIDDLENKKYNFGIVTYDFEGGEKLRSWLEFDNSKSLEEETTFSGLTLKKFDNHNFYCGNGTIDVKMSKDKTNVNFIVGGFATVDSDSGSNYNHDYVEVVTSTGNIIFEVQSTPRIKSNNSNYNATIENIKNYSTDLSGQVRDGSNIHKITLNSIKEKELKIILHTDESFNNEAIGFRAGSLSTSKKIIFDLINNKEVKAVTDVKEFQSNKPSSQNNLWEYSVDFTKYDFVNNARIYFDTSNGWFSIIDFYFNKENFIYNFTNDDNEKIEGTFCHSNSKLPITWGGLTNGENYSIIPGRIYSQKENNAEFYFKPYKENEYYNVSFDLILSGSWDNEIYKILINDKVFYKDIQNQNNNKALNYKIPFIKTSRLNSKLCDNNSVLTSNNDLQLHFNFDMRAESINSIKIYNGLNELVNNELLAIKNFKIERLSYKNVFISNYANKWKDISYNKNEIVATDQLQCLVFSKKNVKKILNTTNSQMYFLRVNTLSAKSIDNNDSFTIKINGKTHFNNAISKANNRFSNALQHKYDLENILVAEEDNYNLTRDKINEVYDVNKFNVLKDIIYSVIEIPFIGTGSDTIEIDYKANQAISDEAYGIDSIEVFSKHDTLPLFSDNIIRVEKGKTNNWKKYGNNGIYVDVDTSNFSFSDNVMYFTSLSGNSGLWQATGETSLYNKTKNGFRIYIYYSVDNVDNVLQYAKDHLWELHWIGVEFKN